MCHRTPLFSIMFMALILCPCFLSAQTKPQKPDQRALDLQYDKLKILHKAEMQTDTAPEFISIPSDYPEVKDFDVAKTPPAIDFAIVQGLNPFYLDDSGIYGGWGAITEGPDGCFYFSIGNHRSYGGTAYMIRYDPAAKSQKIVIDSQKVCGWKPNEFGDGKFHGDPDIAPNGDMWLLTFFGPYPTQQEWDSGKYHGGHIVKFNIFSGKAEDLGIPLEGGSWPYHTWDWERGVLFGVTEVNNYIIAYDTKARKTIYGGSPGLNINWYSRANLIDRETGKIYATNSVKDQTEGHKIVCWERLNNKFTIMKSETPKNPETGKSGALRAYTKRKDADGAFWCFDFYGSMFKFYPAQDKTEFVGMNWGKTGKYTSNICMSPKGRYLYYIPGADTNAYTYGTPVVQYDMKTNRKKVIAFLNDFYLKKYGYSPGGTYGIALDKKGETFFFYMNGKFTTKEKGSGYGRPSLFHLHIPAEERKE